MYSWAIDSYGLRAAHSQSVLDRVRGTGRLHVSPFTWHPAGAAGTGGTFKASLTPGPGIPGHLTLVDSGVSRTRNHAVALDARLRELHGQGVLLLGDDECSPQHVADVEGSWQQAGLVGRPTNETFSAVITADRLGVDLITDDCDVRKLAQHWQVHPMTVAEFASALAA
jgi:hypothetical protein